MAFTFHVRSVKPPAPYVVLRPLICYSVAISVKEGSGQPDSYTHEKNYLIDTGTGYAVPDGLRVNKDGCRRRKC